MIFVSKKKVIVILLACTTICSILIIVVYQAGGLLPTVDQRCIFSLLEVSQDLIGQGFQTLIDYLSQK